MSRSPAKRAGKPRPGSAAPVSIIEATQHTDLFAKWFKDRETWKAWFVLLRAVFGLPLDEEQLALFRQHTGRSLPALGGYFDVSLIVGRRGGKSLVLALIGTFLAALCDWSQYLTGGERGVVMILAADRRQAAVALKYVRAFLDIPLLAGLIERETLDTIELRNGISIEVTTASYKTLRGRTVVAAIADELAFWSSEDSQNPDIEIINALKPAMATIPGARLLKASSPYARRGVLWTDYRKHYGNTESRTLVWKAATREMNPSVPQSFIDEQYEDDPASASAEYGAEFRSDVEAFVSREAVENCVVPGRLEIPPMANATYYAFTDPSGGSSDSMTLAVVHREGEKVVVDAIRESKPPFSPESVVAEYAALLKAYRISKVYGDHYAGLWPRERFEAHGITYMPSAKPKSDLYRDLLPLVNGGRVELLDHPKSINQLCALERKTARSGRDSIDHPPGQHDDVINAIAGAVVHAHVTPKPMSFAPPFLSSATSGFRNFDTGGRSTVRTIDAVPEAPPPGQPITDDLEVLYGWWHHPEKRPADLCGFNGSNRLLSRIRGLEKQLKKEPAELPANPGAPQWSGKFHDPCCGLLHQPPGGWPAGKTPW
jgi:hypothetical protein